MVAVKEKHAPIVKLLLKEEVDQSVKDFLLNTRDIVIQLMMRMVHDSVVSL